MHEMSLMGDILQLVCEDASNKKIKEIKKIELLVGKISNAMPDALQMAFAIYKEQNPHVFFREAELIIKPEEAKAECIICGTEYSPEQKLALCPSCNLPSGKIISGESFQIISYEGSQEK